MSARGKAMPAKEKVSRKYENAREKPSTVNQLEQRTALRKVQELHKSLKMPVPQLPAVLAYLRWLDKMESWIGQKHSSSVNDSSHRETSMYSWSGNFGNPIALPKIKKHRDPEKYSSRQFKESVLKNNYSRSSGTTKRFRSYTARDPSPAFQSKDKLQTERLFRSYNPETLESKKNFKSKSADPRIGGARHSGKPTPFYIHAKEGFQYWPKELYNPPVHPTKYSFGERFNPGRAGVITDRIYAKPRTNKHYWTDFQTRQNPIGSGNAVTGTVMRN